MHGRKKELIIGEIFAKMTLYNLYSRIRNKVEKSREFAERYRNAIKGSGNRRQIMHFLSLQSMRFYGVTAYIPQTG